MIGSGRARDVVACMHLSKWWDSQKNHHRHQLQTIVIASTCRLQWRDVRNPSQSFKMLGVIREILGAHDKVEPEFAAATEFAVELEQQIQAPLSEDLFSGVFFSHC